MKILHLLVAALVSLCINAATDTYHYYLDLTQLANDKLTVTLATPALMEQEVVFSFPKMVPGTYSIYDFGRFVENLKAFDYRGLEMAVEKLDVNSWRIKNASSLAKLTYLLNDTYDEAARGNPIFEPAGTNFQRDTNFVLNLHTVLGYFRNHTKQPFYVHITHTPEFYGGTSFQDKDASSTADLFVAANYNEAIDNPILYARPDTAHITVGTTDVLLALYSPSHKPTARGIARQLDTILQAAGKYLGGRLPVSNYSFLIYLDNKPGYGGGYGALEHSYCSLYYLIDTDDNTLGSILRDIAAHEFFHILTPLNIHSYEIEDFDFDQPKMSAHLWLYEGTTEYHAHAMQVRHGLISPEKFLAVTKEKIDEAQFHYNDSLPFTVMSKGCLDTFRDQYQNVYAKGALIAMCLDLELLHLSKGRYGLMNLIHDLASEYGKNRAFHDEELIPKIVSLTYPEIGDFFARYVSGSEALPFEEVLPYAGVSYRKLTTTVEFTLGDINIGYDQEANQLVIISTANMNAFGQKMGYRDGDRLLKMNGQKIVPLHFQNLKEMWKQNVREGDLLRIVVYRKNENGKWKKVKLSASVFKSDIKKHNTLAFIETPTAEQNMIKKAWLGR